MVNIGGFSAAIVGQAAIGLLVSAHVDFRLAFLPLLVLAAWGAAQTVRHANARGFALRSVSRARRAAARPR